MKKTAVLIPFYRNFLEEFEEKSLNNNLSILQGHKIYIIAPIKFKFDDDFNELVKNYKIEIIFFNNVFFQSIKGYNKLMLDLNFYKRFINYQFLLICQLDALAISNNLNLWVDKEYDYVGAPWVTSFKNIFNFDSMGNGGFSLRRVSKFIEVLESKQLYFNDYKFYNTSCRIGLKYLIIIKLLDKFQFWGFNKLSFFKFLYNDNEDYFWAFIAKFFVKEFSLPDSYEALKFSFEVNPKKCFELNQNRLPFGCHAWNKYDLEFWEDKIPTLKNSIKKP